MDTSLDAWLDTLAIGESIEIGDDQVCLDVATGGATLSVQLISDVLPCQILEAMQEGFSQTLEFNAGLALNEDASCLQLSIWLPGVRQWSQARGALEDLLNQAHDWRESLRPRKAVIPGKTMPREELLRKKLHNKISLAMR